MFTWLENKKLMLDTSLASAVTVKSLLYILSFLAANDFVKRAKTESQIVQNATLGPQNVKNIRPPIPRSRRSSVSWCAAF